MVVAGGMESMSRVPYYTAGARSGLRMGHAQLLDGMLLDGLWRALAAAHPMAMLALSVRAVYGVCFAPTLPANTIALHPFLWQRLTRTTLHGRPSQCLSPHWMPPSWG